MKKSLDYELENITLSEDLRKKIKMSCRNNNLKNSKNINNLNRMTKVALAFCAMLVLSCVTAFAGYCISKINVNDKTLPELDSMRIVKANKLIGNEDEYSHVEKAFTNYKSVSKELNLNLLDSPLAVDNPYMQVKVDTNNTDYIIIKVENYILGDTSNYSLVEDVNLYNCDPGDVYYSSVSLEAAAILSDEQLSIGWNTDYLGYYEYVESYVSQNGYKVNVIQETLEGDYSDIVTKKCAIFVADGIQYTIKCATSIENVKQIVDSMQ